MSETPRFQHDGSDHCRFLGRMEDGNGKPMDGWACMQGGTTPTIILRWSDKPADYTSGSQMFDYLTPELQDAARRWLAEDPDVKVIMDTLKEAGGELPFEQLEHRYYEKGGS